MINVTVAYIYIFVSRSRAEPKAKVSLKLGSDAAGDSYAPVPPLPQETMLFPPPPERGTGSLSRIIVLYFYGLVLYHMNFLLLRKYIFTKHG